MGSTMNTMEDLRKEVASLMRETIHGREIDTLENTVEVPHMIGVTPIGESHSPENERGTILDPSHEFWEEWHDDIVTVTVAGAKVETAIRSLADDGIFENTYPYGKSADIIIPKIDRVENMTVDVSTACLECGEEVIPSLSVEDSASTYELQLSVSCADCGYSGLYSTNFVRK